MSSGTPPLCRYHLSPRGCRKGDRCHFLHTAAASTGSHPATQEGPSSRPPPAQRGRGIGPLGHGGTPRQVCQIFWTTGSCARGFECTRKHERSPREPSDQASSPAPTQTEELDFFSPEGRALKLGLAEEAQHSLNPSECHNHLKAFLVKGHMFHSASRVQGFVRIFASVNARNKSWTSETAQDFLRMIVHGDGILQIGEALRFGPVNYKSGFNEGVLSFQLGYFPIFRFFASSLILKSTLHKNINHLYTVIENNYEVIHANIHANMTGMMQERSWKDPSPNLPVSRRNNLDGATIFETLSIVLLEYCTRFKGAVRNHPEIADLVHSLVSWFDIWASAISATPPSFDDILASKNPSLRQTSVTQLRNEVHRLNKIVDREFASANRLRRQPLQAIMNPAEYQKAIISQVTQTYSPPGELRDDGPRHDNDFADISSIRIAPTHQELLSPINPYLPVFLPEAPHHLPLFTMERHFDIQFRLLREELIATLRASINAIYADLEMMWSRVHYGPRTKEKTLLEDLLHKRGGAYRTAGKDSLFFQLYTNVTLSPVRAERRDLTVGLLLDTPPGTPRDKSHAKRSEYWSHSRRLQRGALVALALVSAKTLQVYLGVLNSTGNDIAESSKANAEQIQVRISFFDPEVELLALRKKVINTTSTFALLIDNGVMFEASRPFLERLQTMEPTDVPFSQCIAHNGPLDNLIVEPPRYATVPGFRFELGCLAKSGGHIHSVDVMSPTALDRARQELRAGSELDSSQVDALVDTLSREISLIQGPPGTGKSFTGRKILQVLLENKIKPIVLIAYTNHALDHMLTSILDENITDRLVRLGSRSSNERITQYSLDAIERLSGATDMERSTKHQYWVMKQLEQSMEDVTESIQLTQLSWLDVEKYLVIQYPGHVEHFRDPPFWITALSERLWSEENEHGQFKTVGKGGKAVNNLFSHTIYGFWKAGSDVQWIRSNQALNAEKNSQTPVQAVDIVKEFFASLGHEGLPPISTSDRDIDILLEDQRVWSMSLRERVRLANEWEQNIRMLAYTSNLDEYKKLRKEYREACSEYNDIKDEARRRLLKNVDLIGCTTTGAAKLINLLSTIAPKVLMVEEAGQVLEAHILTALVPSVHHLICIGDPKQLRPNLATFQLSMDSERGQQLFMFDRSLMERLSDLGLQMSQINVQRRMRPTISHFIRTILYPALQDHPSVELYPEVQGMQKNAYFLSHTNPEGGSEDSVSKFNEYEANMVRDLVLYFLRQGRYSASGDIAVLCAYLGQLQKVRASLRDMKIAVSIDEWDQENLEQQGLEDDGEFEDVLVAKHIKLGTVDVFQGQEAKIVIVSLVRNSGMFETGGASIGFLKSSNRINVALSRAKHGLYILGNASNLKKNPTWRKIVEEMEAREEIGPGFPIVCPRHPNETQIISKPGELDRLSPAGGCLIPCSFRLLCGHICPSKCHAALDGHRNTKCYEHCNRAPCPRSHPCLKQCYEDCGKCNFPMHGVILPCGHMKDGVSCYMMEDLSKVECTAVVPKRLPRCEHSSLVACSQDPKFILCREPCGKTLQCCGRMCKSPCDSCQRAEVGSVFTVRDETFITRTRHNAHPCERSLYCEHLCGLDCSWNHECNMKCTQQCRQRCGHYQCPLACHTPCPPCMEPCEWLCSHHTCPVVCGSICPRLPCDEACTTVLECGHNCPSVCGEPCAKQMCPQCLPEEKKADIVDVILQRPLSEIDLFSSDISERLITLECGHIFTVETLDGHCKMSDYYEVDIMGRYLGTKAPPINYQIPPACPTCRGPITALRYGRVMKRATLDILEQNVASTMSQALENVGLIVAGLLSTIDAAQDMVKTLPAVSPNFVEPSSSYLDAARGKDNEPLSIELLTKGAMTSLHGFNTLEAKRWDVIVRPYLKAYNTTTKIARTRGAHVKAYEAALVTIYRLEMDELIHDPPENATALEQMAFNAVNMKIGQPPHKADTRYQIEAYFLSLEIRYMLAEIAISRIKDIDVLSEPEPEREAQYTVWCTFVMFIYESCEADAGKALVMAQKSSASRQAARASLYSLRSTIEGLRFKIQKTKEDLIREGRWTQDRRNALVEEFKDKKEELFGSLQSQEKAYIRSRPVHGIKDLREEQVWFTDNCTSKFERWMEDLDNLMASITRDTFYQKVSRQEREDIVKAFGFSHRGHFFNCENGHTFVITECGGAMQTALCPECRAPIGGSSHNLLASNSRAMEFEDIAKQEGSETAPWPWGRGA